MKKLLLMAICAAAVLAARAAEQPVTPQAKVELFNGKDLTGWVTHSRTNAPGQVWSVQDGLLKCVGKPSGYLRTEKAYANYRATVEWRFTKAGNTGVLVHMNGRERIWPACIECQGMHKAQGDMYFWNGAKAKELTQGVKVPRKGADAEKPVGEWNTYQVICARDTVTILVNGQELNRATGCTPATGQFGLQSEGAQLEVRRVTLEPLAP
jgi:hypothetical protein